MVIALHCNASLRVDDCLFLAFFFVSILQEQPDRRRVENQRSATKRRTQIGAVSWPRADFWKTLVFDELILALICSRLFFLLLLFVSKGMYHQRTYVHLSLGTYMDVHEGKDVVQTIRPEEFQVQEETLGFSFHQKRVIPFRI